MSLLLCLDSTLLPQACAHFHGTTHSLSLPVLWFYELLCVTAHLAKFVCANLNKSRSVPIVTIHTCNHSDVLQTL